MDESGRPLKMRESTYLVQISLTRDEKRALNLYVSKKSEENPDRRPLTATSAVRKIVVESLREFMKETK
jgi:hypothetical protein